MRPISTESRYYKQPTIRCIRGTYPKGTRYHHSPYDKFSGHLPSADEQDPPTPMPVLEPEEVRFRWMMMPEEMGKFHGSYWW